MIKSQTHAALGTMLAFIAGAINAGGFFTIGYYTSHMTGIVSSVADYIALHQFDSAITALSFVASFICGAISTSLIVNYARSKKFKSEYAGALIFESILLLFFGLASSKIIEYHSSLNVFLISFLCFIMGVQNAIITKISNSTIRTTHVTGLATDIGIELGRYMYRLFSNEKNLYSNFDKIKLYFLLIISFLIGGILGAFSFKIFGAITAIPLSLILIFLALNMMFRQD